MLLPFYSPFRNTTNNSALNNLIKHSTILFSGNLFASILGVATMTLTARVLGVRHFGILVLIITYSNLIDGFFNFQSHLAIIKYGAEALTLKHTDRFKSLLKFGFLIDSATALFSTFVAISLAWFWGGIKGWTADLPYLVSFYSLTILFHINGTPVAVLRLFGKYNKIAYQYAITAGVKFLGVLFAYFSFHNLYAFLFFWAISDIFGKLALMYFAYTELKANNLSAFLLTPINSMLSDFKGLWSFVLTTNIYSALNLGLKEVDVFLIGILLGPSGAGLYKIVKLIGATVIKIQDPLVQVVYPDLARYVSDKNYKHVIFLLTKPMKYILPLLLLFLIFFYFCGEYGIALLLGPAYHDSFYPALFYLIGTSISLLTFSFRPALLAFGKSSLSLYALFIASIIYISLLFVSTRSFGLIGAAISYCCFSFFFASMQALIICFVFKRTATF